MSVDLRTCKPGQKLRTRGGSLLEYAGQITEGDYRHRTRNGYTYTDVGRWSILSVCNTDIIEILPMEPSVTKLRVDPLIFGASQPEFVPIPGPTKGEYEDLTDEEAWSIWRGLDPYEVTDTVRYIHRMGHEGKRSV